MKIKNLYLILLLTVISSFSVADELELDKKNTEFNIYTGMFDFSDDGKSSTLIGFQHQNEDLNRDTFL